MMIGRIKLLYIRIDTIAASQPTIYAKPITKALVLKPFSEFAKPTLKISRINRAPPNSAKVNAPMLESNMARLNKPRCDIFFPLRNGKGGIPLRDVLDG